MKPHKSQLKLNQPSPYSCLGIVSVADPQKLPYTFHPSRNTAIRLWTFFVQGVESYIGIKLLHVPTDEHKFFCVIKNPHLAELEDLALCFAIYFSASVMMAPAELSAILDSQDITQTLLIFKTGFEQSLAHADFLNVPTFTIFRALLAYLVSRRIDQNDLEAPADTIYDSLSFAYETEVKDCG